MFIRLLAQSLGPSHVFKTGRLTCTIVAALSAIAFVCLRSQHLSPAASAAPVAGITVNSTADVAVVGDGLCTLREAIMAANGDTSFVGIPGDCVAGSGTDMITIAVTGTISLASPLPAISSNMSINGPGASQLTIQRSTAGGTPNFRVFDVSVSANMSGVTITNGRGPDATSVGTSGVGGAGIFNAAGATLTLTDVSVSGNRTGDGGAGNGVGGGSGGGIQNFGTLLITNSTIRNNVTGFGGNNFGPGGGGGGGAGIMNFGTVTIINSTISDNQAGNGGNGGTGGASISGGNGGGGGGILNATTLTLINCTVSNNAAGNGGAGGGGATSTGGLGGGISNSGTLTLINTSIAGNRTGAGGSGGAAGNGGGVWNSSSTTVNMKNTLVA